MTQLHRHHPSIIILPILSLLSLAACQPSQVATPSLMPIVNFQTASPTPTVLPEDLRLTPDELSGQDVSIWLPWLDDRADQLSYLVDDFNSTNAYGIHVKITTWGGEMALSDAMADGLTGVPTLPDIFVALPEDAFSLQRAGIELVALDDYLASQDWGLSEDERADRIAPVWQLGEEDGLQYGVPAETLGHFLFYNLTWGLELGFNAPPKTHEDFLLQTCKAERANLEDGVKANNGTGGWLIASDSTSMLAWLTGFGFRIPTQSPYLFNLPETKSTFDYLKSLLVKECAWLGKQTTPYDYFAGRYTLIYSGTLADIAGQRAAFSRTGNTDQWVLIPYPVKSGISTTLVDGMDYFITKSDPVHQLAAWLFLRWMNEQAQQARLSQANGMWPSRSSVTKTLEIENSSDLIYTYIYRAMETIQPVPHAADWAI
ncbi:MAG: extracellular solute-binding protein, partial [Anaerolineaceae bacterium]